AHRVTIVQVEGTHTVTDRDPVSWGPSTTASTPRRSGTAQPFAKAGRLHGTPLMPGARPRGGQFGVSPATNRPRGNSSRPAPAGRLPGRSSVGDARTPRALKFRPNRP